ncbi:MAG TPA: hypothetical protein VG963_15375 [Polyangiaceae bacterium]|nr:hypothetical protein [Polyangiaceae bacterium]
MPETRRSLLIACFALIGACEPESRERGARTDGPHEADAEVPAASDARPPDADLAPQSAEARADAGEPAQDADASERGPDAARDADPNAAQDAAQPAQELPAFRSGSRLRAILYVPEPRPEEGACDPMLGRSFAGLHDAALAQDCDYTRDADGTLHCTRGIGITQSYASPDCAEDSLYLRNEECFGWTPLALPATSACAEPRYRWLELTGSLQADGCAPFATLGMPSLQPWYELVGDSCQPAGNAVLIPCCAFRDAPPERFVRASERWTELGHGLSIASADGEDGSIAPRGLYQADPNDPSCRSSTIEAEEVAIVTTGCGRLRARWWARDGRPLAPIQWGSFPTFLDTQTGQPCTPAFPPIGANDRTDLKRCSPIEQGFTDDASEPLVRQIVE